MRHAHRCTISVTKRCQGLLVSRGGGGAWARGTPSPRTQRRPQRLLRIQAVYAASQGRYGSPKIAAQLRREGDCLSGKTVAPWKRQTSLRVCVVRRDQATTSSRPDVPVADPGLAQRCTASRPPAVWTGDLPDIGTDDGGLYRTTLEDLATRPLVGGALAPHMTQDLTLAAVDRAVARHRPPAGLLHHSDRGSQYAAYAYQGRVARYRMVGSMSRKGNGYDNACMESWHSLIKKELIYLSHYHTRDEARSAIVAVPRDRL